MTSRLYEPFDLGDLRLANRMVMAPLTRNRAAAGDVPHALNAVYYAQRASAGLIISEATQISPEGKGYISTPGLYSSEQVEGWRLVTDAVHKNQGRIFSQLWHVGRISHTSLQPNGAAPVAPSAITADAQTFTEDGPAAVSPPRALETSEIKRIVNDYRAAAENAKAAGFDGIEIHAANGYLLDQFLRDGSNKRTDAYGGSVENRVRLLGEVMDAVLQVFPASRVGVRLSPFSAFNDMSDSDPMTIFSAAVRVANAHKLAYLHMVEGEMSGSRDTPESTSIAHLRGLFDGAYMANNGYDRELAEETVDRGDADLIALGRPFLANPDLVARFKAKAELNKPQPSSFYGGGAAGYTDYPTLEMANT